MATPNSHNNWGTPPELFEVLNREFLFDLDAAASVENALVPNFISQEQDALVTPWVGRAVFCNPPYSRGNEGSASLLTSFIRRGYEQSVEQCNTVVMLIPAYTDPKYWRDYCTKAHEIRFLTGRLKFLENGHIRTSARFPSVLVIFKWLPGTCYKAPNTWLWDWRVR